MTPAGHRDRLLVAVVALAVALAVADSSVVVLALPDIYGTFDVSIVTVSWTITAYNLAIVVGAIGVLAIERRVRGHVLAGVGLGVFAGASLLCGFSSSFELLIVGRTLQGVGAALALVGAIPVLSGIRGSDAHAIKVWGLAGTIGVAVGPALGGFLTQLFSWRSIFLLQAPLAAIALVAVFDRRVRAVERAPQPEGRARDRPRQLRVPRALRRAGRRAVPVGVTARRRVGLVTDRGRAGRDDAAHRHDRRSQAAFPGFRTGPRSRWAVSRSRADSSRSDSFPRRPPVGPRPRSVPAGSGWDCWAAYSRRRRCRRTGPGLRPATISIAARHAGFVLALAVIAPVLSANLNEGARLATRATTAEVLDSSVSLRTKVSLAFDLRDLVGNAPRGEVPDPTVPFDKRGAATDANLRETRDAVVSAIRDTLTREFRASFLIAALFAVAAAIAAALIRGARRPSHSSASAFAVASLIVVMVVALVAGEFRAGARDFARREYADPCTAPADPFPQGNGIDGTLQRISLSAINGAACELHTTREELLLSTRFGERLRRGRHVDAARCSRMRCAPVSSARSTTPTTATPFPASSRPG